VANRNLERTLLLSGVPLLAARSGLDCILFSERSSNGRTMPVFAESDCSGQKQREKTKGKGRCQCHACCEGQGENYG
jgi:hypothetical protein